MKKIFILTGLAAISIALLSLANRSRENTAISELQSSISRQDSPPAMKNKPMNQKNKTTMKNSTMPRSQDTAWKRILQDSSARPISDTFNMK